MKKGEFDLTGKAIDCRELPEMGYVGVEIFRALKVACNGVDDPKFGRFESISTWRYLAIHNNGTYDGSHGVMKIKIQPSDVLGQAAIDAAKDGATLVFEGDVVPRHSNVIFYEDGTKMHGCDTREYTLGPDHIVIACRPLEEKQPSIESRVLSEKMGFKELCPACGSKDRQDHEVETYDELRESHLNLVRESMEKDKEIELLKQRIKDMHRAINDAKAALDV